MGGSARPRDCHQMILISGESGAGKTVAAQMVVDYIRNRLADGATVLSEAGSSIRNALEQMSPLMEAFGHAKTLSNDNASKVGGVSPS